MSDILLHVLVSLGYVALAIFLWRDALLPSPPQGGLMMAMMERGLHRGNLPRFLQGLPPLLTMEQLLFRIIAAGFVLLTLTLASGILFSEALFGKPMSFTHKTVFGILSWIIFAALLAGRALYGWRGRVAMRWTLAGFLSLVLAYIGSKFVLEVLLQR